MGTYSIFAWAMNFTLYFWFFLPFISYSCYIVLQLLHLIKVNMDYSFPLWIIIAFISYLWVNGRKYITHSIEKKNIWVQNRIVLHLNSCSNDACYIKSQLYFVDTDPAVDIYSSDVSSFAYIAQSCQATHMLTAAFEEFLNLTRTWMNNRSKSFFFQMVDNVGLLFHSNFGKSRLNAVCFSDRWP